MWRHIGIHHTGTLLSQKAFKRVRRADPLRSLSTVYFFLFRLGRCALGREYVSGGARCRQSLGRVYMLRMIWSLFFFCVWMRGCVHLERFKLSGAGVDFGSVRLATLRIPRLVL